MWSLTALTAFALIQELSKLRKQCFTNLDYKV